MVGARRLEYEGFCGTGILAWRRVGGGETGRLHRIFLRGSSSLDLIFKNIFFGRKIIKGSQYVDGQRGGRQPKLV